MKHIALLRGINVSGQKKINMSDLKILISNIDKVKNVQTYIQSGNVIFESDIDIPKKLSNQIYTYIYKQYNFEVEVIVKDHFQWNRIISNNPYLKDSSIDTKCMYVTFLNEKPDSKRITLLESVDFTPDSFIINNQIIYSYYANGIGKSKMNNNTFENKLKTIATTRNWNTMINLMKLCNPTKT